MNDMTTGAKLTVEALSVTTVIGTIAGWLPAIAALFSIAWYAVRLWESRTVQGWFGRKPTTASQDE